jgi:hypothetical protein
MRVQAAKNEYKSCEEILKEDKNSYNALEIGMIKFVFLGEVNELFKIYNSLISLRCVSVLQFH